MRYDRVLVPLQLDLAREGRVTGGVKGAFERDAVPVTRGVRTHMYTVSTGLGLGLRLRLALGRVRLSLAARREGGRRAHKRRAEDLAVPEARVDVRVRNVARRQARRHVDVVSDVVSGVGTHHGGPLKRELREGAGAVLPVRGAERRVGGPAERDVLA